MELILLLFGVFLCLVVLGLPIAHAILSAVMVTLIFGFDLPPIMVVGTLLAAVDQWVWLALPLFLMLGNLMNAAGITEKLVDFAQAVVGHISGGLAHVGVLTNILMAGMSGSPNADAAATGSVLIPQMKMTGYPAGYTSMLISISSLIGPLIPPSVGLIMVGAIGRLSILRLWFGGVVPGLMLGLGLLITNYIVAKNRRFAGLEQKASFKRMARKGFVATPALLVPVVILGGMRLGFFSPTESAAVGVVYILLVGSLIYRKLSLNQFGGAAWTTVQLTGLILWIIATAVAFGQVVGRIDVGPSLVAFLVGVSESPTVFLAVSALLLAVLGCLMDSSAVVLILFPIAHIVAVAYGIDSFHFGVFFYYVILCGQATPPVGPGMFITNAIAGCTPKDYIVEGWPLLLVPFALIPFFIFFPQLVTWLPNLILGPTL